MTPEPFTRSEVRSHYRRHPTRMIQKYGIPSHVIGDTVTNHRQTKNPKVYLTSRRSSSSSPIPFTRPRAQGPVDHTIPVTTIDTTLMGQLGQPHPTTTTTDGMSESRFSKLVRQKSERMRDSVVVVSWCVSPLHGAKYVFSSPCLRCGSYPNVSGE